MNCFDTTPTPGSSKWSQVEFGASVRMDNGTFVRFLHLVPYDLWLQEQTIYWKEIAELQRDEDRIHELLRQVVYLCTLPPQT
ncbi:hypothetical protein N7532_005875 [Penicillium argentinense]|uniref:Uncharacterized protein n=1 Tax=Penicillium argentinense TaxID=1131581 RepID=A0A9W9FEU9_9EURO|nr:uncharacterized protein N7532_005875 [Penicillium argentinense]KAJ5098874.1 hypothetical protein N7532_005875 [Penicillium argentinense]